MGLETCSMSRMPPAVNGSRSVRTMFLTACTPQAKTRQRVGPSSADVSCYGAERRTRRQADRDDPWDRLGRQLDVLESAGDGRSEESWNAWRQRQVEKEQQEEQLRKRLQQEQQQSQQHQQPAAAAPMPVTTRAALAALQLPTTSTPPFAELQAAYRRAALRCHPDRPQNRGRQDAATAEFQQVKAAFDLLQPNAK